MTTVEALLHLRGPEDLTDCSTLLNRLVRLDPTGLVRLQHDAEKVSLWAQPLNVVVRREVHGRMTVADRTVSAAAMLVAVDGPGSVLLPPPRDRAWTVTLPPRGGWAALDVVPVAELRQLTARAARVVREASDPSGAGESLLDQETLRVAGGTDEVVLPLRVVVVLTRLGFLGPAGQTVDVVRVACTPTWTRLAARHGTVYQRRAGLGLGFG